MIGEEIPNAINIFLGIYTLIILVLAFFINRYFIRKNSSIFINILCVFLWFTILLMIIVFPLDLFSNYQESTLRLASSLKRRYNSFSIIIVYDEIQKQSTGYNAKKTKISDFILTVFLDFNIFQVFLLYKSRFYTTIVL